MTLVFLETAAIILSLGFVLYLSSVEMAVHQANAVTLRMLLERGSGAVRRLASLALEDRAQLLLPLHLGTQTAFIAVVVLTVHLCILEWGERGVLYSLGIVLGLNLVFRQLLPRLGTFHAPERKLVRLLSLIYPLYMLLHWLAFPLVGILKAFQRLHQRTQPELSAQESEASEEEIQAYLDIGEDEGILEEEDSELIQSVVEFGDTVAREVMTPRTRIIGCSETATLSELRDIMVNHRHSRIPIFRGDLDHIVGAANIRQLLACYTHGRESEPITDLIQPAFFVPETKRVSALLNELQERAGHLA
ncbi:MAG: CNNM domain-containing protein, partial [Acidobacteriota bacterium]